MPSHLLSNYFQLIYTLKLTSESSDLLEEYLLNDLPTEIWEKVNYDEQKQELFSSDKEAINVIKKTIQKNQKITIAEEKNYWKPLFFKLLSSQKEKKYYSQLQKELKNINFQQNIKFYTNVED
jgi:hypothetical protein